MKKKPITIASRKQKARWLQNWVCQWISTTLDIAWGYEDGKFIQPRIMGQSGTDVILRDEALNSFPFAIECKNSETWSIPDAIRQVKKNTKKPYQKWLLFMKRKEFKNPIVILDAVLFFEIYDQLLENYATHRCEKVEL